MTRLHPIAGFAVLLAWAGTAAGSENATIELPRTVKVTYQSKDRSVRHGSLGGDVYDADRRFALALGKQGWIRSEQFPFQHAGRAGLLSIWHADAARTGRPLYLFVVRAKKAGRTEFIIGDESPETKEEYHEQQ